MTSNRAFANASKPSALLTKPTFATPLSIRRPSRPQIPKNRLEKARAPADGHRGPGNQPLPTTANGRLFLLSNAIAANARSAAIVIAKPSSPISSNGIIRTK